MKNFASFLLGLSVFLICLSIHGYAITDNQTSNKPENSGQKTITVACNPELNALLSNWAAEFVRENPEINIEICGIEDIGETENAIRFISDENINKSGVTPWKMVIGRNVVVPIVNSKNPMVSEICSEGLSAARLTQLISGNGEQVWSSIIKNGQAIPVNFFISDDQSVNDAVAQYAQTDISKLNPVRIKTSAELINSVKNDLYAIGFCHLTDICNPDNNAFIAGVEILPVDKNMNGRIDHFENIYKSPDDFLRGVWIGKYPTVMSGHLYATSLEKPQNLSELAFLNWIINEGQKSLSEFGYGALASVEIQSNSKALNNIQEIAVISEKPNYSMLFLLIVIGLIVISSLLVAFIKSSPKVDQLITGGTIKMSSAMNEETIKAPKGLYYDKTHTWAFMQQDGKVKIGLDDFLQTITGTLTRINMKEPGCSICKGEKIFSIVRDGKQLNIYSPISGTIVEKNQSLNTATFLINASPYNDGWVYMIEPKKWLRETQFMFMAEKYKEWLKDEFARLKDFFASSMRSNSAVYSHIILQDGGELTENILADLGPEVWEDFQNNFINVSK